MIVNQNKEKLITKLADWYGDGSNGTAPTVVQWAHILERPTDAPITLVNFFKLREIAVYTEGSAHAADPGTGQDAFNRYAQISMPTLQKIGGSFLSLGAFEHGFIGGNEDWDIIAIAHYPNSAALIALYEDEAYCKAFTHRTAALAHQKVSVGTGQ
ncbi:MAG: DUF1330 domain-containing protein [Kordiimonadaceae bacterium]|nr:DUF1330 domain-containing protein [Kordiimonadaceae bacterium]